MKKVLCGVILLFMLFTLFAACPEAGINVTDNGDLPDSLADTVYAGEDASGNWATFAFIDESKVYFFPDNTAHHDLAYTCAPDGTGEITGEAGTVPGAFRLSADGKTITFTNYLGSQGQRDFKRLRQAGGIDDAIPFTYTPLKPGDSLDKTVWAATGFRTQDWTTLTVSSTGGTLGTIQVSHSFDCTSFPRTYTGYAYNTETTLSYIGPFIVKGGAGGDVFTFQNFYGHGGKIPLKRMR
jgi:hypothetical protein